MNSLGILVEVRSKQCHHGETTKTCMYALMTIATGADKDAAEEAVLPQTMPGTKESGEMNMTARP